MLTDEEKRILLQNRLFAELPAERLDGLLQKLSSRTACFGKNSVIWGMGERIDHAGIVLSGRVEAWRYTQDGQESLSAVHEAGGLFGDVLMSARTVGSPVELRTARPSKILFLSLDALLRCCAEDGGSDCTRLLSNLLEEISEKYWALQRHIRLLSIPDGRTRLEAYLRQEAGKTGEIVCAGMTRERMARYLGMKPPTPERYRNVNDRSAKAERGRRQLPDDRRHAKADSLTSALCTCCGRCADTMRAVPHKSVLYLIFPDSELPANTGHIS